MRDFWNLIASSTVWMFRFFMCLYRLLNRSFVAITSLMARCACWLFILRWLHRFSNLYELRLGISLLDSLQVHRALFSSSSVSVSLKLWFRKL